MLKFKITFKLDFYTNTGHRKGHKGEDKGQILTVGLGPARFQLQYMGHYVVHDERKDPDPRVQDFVPNNWQVMPEFSIV